MTSHWKDCGWARYKKVDVKMGELVSNFISNGDSVNYLVERPEYYEAVNYLKRLNGVKDLGSSDNPYFVFKVGEVNCISSARLNNIVVSGDLRVSDDDTENLRVKNELNRILDSGKNKVRGFSD